MKAIERTPMYFVEKRYKYGIMQDELDKQIHKIEQLLDEIRTKHKYLELKQKRNIATNGINAVNKEEYKWVREKGFFNNH